MFRDARDNPSLRSIALILEYLDKSYDATSRERETHALEKSLKLRREGSETAQAFLLRFEAIVATLENTSSIWPSGLVFVRALKSMQLNHQQKTAVLMMIECQNNSHDVDNVKSVSIWSFGLYRDVAPTRQNAKTFMSAGAVLNGDEDKTSDVREREMERCIGGPEA